MKKLVWEKVNNKENVYIHCQTFESAKDFLDDCFKRNIKWVDGTNVCEDEQMNGWEYYNKDTVYCLDRNGLSFQSLQYTKESNVNIIEWNI